MAQWEYQNMTYPLLLLPPPPPHTLLAVSRRPSPFHPSLSSPGFFNREHICCRNSSEGHVNPPWHSWLSRQTDGQASGLTPLTRGPKGTRIYNWPNLTPRRRNSARTDQQIHGKLTIQDSYFNPQTSQNCSALTPAFQMLNGMNYSISWCWFDSDVVCLILTNCRKQMKNEIIWA